jgi:hypothetical protein
MAINRISELSAVNVMLAAIGEAPVEDVWDTDNSDVVSAVQTLHNTSRSVQAEGWYFNTETNYPLVADSAGNITLPNSVISVDIEPSNAVDKADAILRGNRLYNLETHSYAFTRGLEYRATITFYLEFEQLPESAKEYIVIRAARRFQTDSVGSETLEKFTEKDEYSARSALMREEVLDGDYNMFSGGNRNSTFGLMSPRNIILNRRL